VVCHLRLIILSGAAGLMPPEPPRHRNPLLLRYLLAGLHVTFGDRVALKVALYLGAS
jgi:hypothetical protein